MRKLLAWGLLTALALAGATPSRAVEKDDIDRAIDNGVRALRQMKRADGAWPYMHIGATALAGLTLLECGTKEDDKDVQDAANAVRKASLTLTHTYSIALSILFLDRLGDAGDVPLIESLMVRLLGGQSTQGGWSYDCPSIGAAEVRRLQAKLDERKELVGRRELPKAAAKRTEKDLAPEIREQLHSLERFGTATPPAGPPRVGPPLGQPMIAPTMIQGMPGDNSNTQFAALALWVGRRHGLPVEKALTRLARRFRTTQMDDGGWNYMGTRPGYAGMVGLGSTATMTCAGLLSLAIVDGATLEYLKERKPNAKAPEGVRSDKQLQKGLQSLGAVLENPKNIRLTPFDQLKPENRVGGRTYYFLWSLERVAVALDLRTIGKKDWYGWGAEILLENQLPNGSWSGDYNQGGADTCFALLFLKRANLARDLTAHIQGKVSDPGERVLRGGTSLDKTRGKKSMSSGIETADAKPIQKPLPIIADTESEGLAKDLVKAAGARRGELLEEMESGKGPKYTEALALAIPKLDGETHRKARDALANRLTRMKDETLTDYLQDEDAEIRRAAALAAAMKESKALVPNLISLLHDSETSVVRAAHAALKSLTGQDFGPAVKATREQRDQAVLKWIEWWSKQRKKPTKE